MPDIDPSKKQAADAAARMITDGMVVGLGSGSTATLLIKRLGERVRDEGLKIVGVPTSVNTANLATSLGVPLVDIDAQESLDISIDGADEVDAQFRMIKGLGGALLREKIVASAAKRRVFIVGDNKRVTKLGERTPVPVEISPFGLERASRELRRLGGATTLRLAPDGSPFVTDGGNRIVDCKFPGIDDPEGLEAAIRKIVGVFETGLFLDFCDALIIGHENRSEVIEHAWA